MNTPFNQTVLQNLKHHINTNFKLIGFQYQKQGDVFNASVDDLLTVKVMCKECVCSKVIEFFQRFSHRYDFYMEVKKVDVNGHFQYHQFVIYIKK